LRPAANIATKGHSRFPVPEVIVPSRADALSAALTERVLERLGCSAVPSADLNGLNALYSAWCRKVPFDNIRKLIHVNRNETGPLPGDSAVDFFEAWLRFGAGGTCWAGNGALCCLLSSIGFDARRGLATMLAAPNLSPNHGTVVVDFGRERYIVDASILHGTPLRVVEPDSIEAHPAWGVHLIARQGQWIIHWRPLHKPDGFECRIERMDVPRETFSDLHERSRGWSPFNYQLYARLNHHDSVIGTGFGQRVEFDATGQVSQRALAPDERIRFMVEELGIAEELAARLPPDRPTPPPPG
jgi:arylamine N-acetyltransferase